MIELLKLILFGTSLWITPEPIDLRANEPYFADVDISAINDNAAFFLDVTAAMGVKITLLEHAYGREKEIFDGYGVFLDAYYDGGVMRFYHNDLYSYGESGVRMMLRSEQSVKGFKFKKIKLVSNKDLRNVKLLWSNGSL